MLYLGLDSSTQSLSGIVIDTETRAIVWEHGVNFSDNFPAYGTQNGTLRDDDPTVVHAPPLMWVEALEAVLAALAASDIPVADIRAVSGSGQQHGSVYLNAPIADLTTGTPLKDQVAPRLSRQSAPIWMDSSTSDQCARIRQALGGPEATARATGSNMVERFTGPQIAKFAETDPTAYESTATVALVSSFLSSLLLGRTSPIEPGDGAGMNLMDIASRDWHPAAVEATAPGLAAKLPPVVASSALVGTIDPYFVETYGFSPDCQCAPWSGDNPCSIIGLGLVTPGQTAISLGTSDVLFGSMGECKTDPNAEGHVFGSPTGGYMSLIVFKNGSLAREAVKDTYNYSWDDFSHALRATTPGNGGALMLPWFEPEIVPRVLTPGVHRRDLDDTNADANCRAVVEAQMMSTRLHSEWMGERPNRIYATGGASANPQILQIMADVHQCPVHRFETTNSAALGAALRAAQAHQQSDWEDAVADFTSPVPGSEVLPTTATAPIYEDLLAAYAAFEAEKK